MPGVIESLVLTLIFATPAAAIGMGAASAIAAGIGSALFYGGLSVGLSMLARKTPATPPASDIQANVSQAVSPRRNVCGRMFVGSVRVFGFRRGEKSYILHYICEGPVQGPVVWYLDKRPITLDADGFVEDTQYIVKGRSRVQILSTLGLMTDEPFQELLDAFPELDTPLTPFRHRGCCMALQIVEQVPRQLMGDVYPNNLPSLQVVMDGRTDVLDPATMTREFSDNAGRLLVTELMDVYGLTENDGDAIDFEAFAIHAAHCAELVSKKGGGTEARYRASGVTVLNAENEERVRAFANVCNADVYINPRGQISVRPRISTTPGIALRARNGDHLDVQLDGGRSEQKKFNAVKIQYVDPALGWKENEVIWRHAGLMAQDDEELFEPLSIPLCPSPSQAQRLGKLHLFGANPEFTGAITSGPQGLDLLENPTFTFDLSPETDFERTASVAGDITFDPGRMTVSASIVVYMDGATDWTPATDEQSAVAVPPALPSSVDDVTLDVTVTADALANSAPVLQFSWDAAFGTLPDSYAQELQISITGLGDWVDVVVNQDDRTATFGPVADGAAYDWRIRNIMGNRKGDWQPSGSPVTVTVDPASPGDLVGVAVGGSLLGAVDVAFTAPASENVKRVKVYRNTNGTLNRATDLVESVPVSSGQAITKTYGVAATSLLTNGGFTGSSTGWTLDADWSYAANAVSKVGGAANRSLAQSGLTLSNGVVYRIGFTISAWSAGNLLPRLQGGATANGMQLNFGAGAGRKSQKITGIAAHTSLQFTAFATTALTLDDIALFAEAGGSHPQGQHYYWLVAENASGVEGALSGPHAVHVI